MERFIFREDLAERHLEQRIRKWLEIHRLVGFEELCRDADAHAGTVRAILDAMIERREVERLRPVSYTKEDMDFFLMCHPALGTRPALTINSRGGSLGRERVAKIRQSMWRSSA
ncbi:MAG: hypothetical protein KKG09_08460 [Verrucomicrobia bacterium]|nr:hypothetical protein [Verrucomicrobiota bacterium]MBU4247879.1 hypothetical protein [Verrucomicrobiota bacterium]MBU4292243.1 hypothetical protein [Verrucomicrobiota bacterium]MBU4427988.1 hypothetical protein [Verrucomicrobiota bacterium]MBU4498021.1 hypothetical protein [Verrucomicrobiota bacterium]